MRRALAALAVLAVLGLLLWLALGGGDSGSAGDGTSVDPAAAPADDPDQPRMRGADRGEEEEEAATAAPADDPWDDLGQERQVEGSATIVGRVYTAPDMPAAGAIVEAVTPGAGRVRKKTAADGAFELRNVPAGLGVDLDVRAPGHASGGLARLVLGPGQRMDIGTLYVGIAIDPTVDNALTVRVTDAEGTALEGVRVTATTLDYGGFIAMGPMAKEPGGVVLRAESDARGRARFAPVPPGTYDVIVQATGFVFKARQRFVMQRETKATLDFALEPGLVIEGKAVDAEGKPLEGATIGALSFGDFAMVPSVQSDAEGKFAIEGVRDTGYMLFAVKEEHGGAMAQNVRPGVEDLVVTIERGGELNVKVVDKESGEPVTRFGVRPYRNIPFGYLYAPILEVESDAGTYTTVMPQASYGLEVSAPGYRLGRVATAALDTPEPIVVELERAGVVHGRVVARLTGRAVIGAKVYVKRGGFPATPYKDLQTVTDAQGVFVLDKLGLEPLNFRITHVDHTEENIEGVTPQLRTAEGELPAPQDFALGDGGRIEGRVFGADHVPAVGETMYLTLSGFDMSFNRSTTVGASGTYAFTHVPVGPSYTVSVGSFMPGQGGSQRSDVQVEEGGITTVDFGTEGGGQTLRGRVMRDGAPAANVAMSLASADGGSSMEQARTDDAGVFVFDGLRPGRYQVTANAGRRRSAEVKIEEGVVPEELELVLVASGVSGKVVDASTGQPLGGVYVECEQVVEAGGSSLTTVAKAWKGNDSTDQEGQYAIEGLEEGTYRVRTYSDRYGVELVEIRIAEGEMKTGVVIELSAGGAFTGFVRNAAGAPVEGATLQVKDASGRSVFLIGLTTSSSDGSYTQSGLKPGTYDVRFEKDGYAPASARIEVDVSTPVQHDFVMLQGGRIDVTATDGTGQPVKGLRVRLYDARGELVSRGLALGTLFSLKETKTNPQGQATVKGVAPGTYTVKLLRDDQVVGSGQAEVVESASTSLDVQVHAQ